MVNYFLIYIKKLFKILFRKLVFIHIMFKPYYLSNSTQTTVYTLLPYLTEHNVIKSKRAGTLPFLLR